MVADEFQPDIEVRSLKMCELIPRLKSYLKLGLVARCHSFCLFFRYKIQK
jgi:hypothetical protein